MLWLQKTVSKSVTVQGSGLHTGTESTLTFHPAPINSGIVFVVQTEAGEVVIPARVENVAPNDQNLRNTCLCQDDAHIHTVEHVLAALSGVGVTNCRIEIRGIEPPEPTGGGIVSYVESLDEAGVVDQGLPALYYRIPALLRYREGDVEITAVPADDFRLTVQLCYADPLIGEQEATYTIRPDVFRSDIAPARTFVMKDDVAELKASGFAKGGTLDNTLVVDQGKLVGDQKLRFDNEFARHKLLDLLGDLTLLGMPIQGHITARRSGHACNVAFTRRIAKRERKQPRIYPPRDATFWDIGSIIEIMPHRYPFLLVDRIIDLEPGKRVVGLKNVTINEPFFQGHFPGHPIMPAVLIIEAMAQTGGVLLLSSVDDPGGKLVYFSGIDQARFRQPVVPGDQLRFELELIKLRGPICKMTGVATVDGKKVAEAELMSNIVER
ncbi:MAG: UDP-3-O-acyl-N-acetylglucosamine deacetylase [bacterium]